MEKIVYQKRLSGRPKGEETKVIAVRVPTRLKDKMKFEIDKLIKEIKISNPKQ